MKTTFSRIAAILVMFVTFSSMSFAQKITKSQFKELMAMDYIENDYKTDSKNIQNIIGSLNIDTTNISAYLSAELADDVVECLMPYYSNNLTYADYKALKNEYISEKNAELRNKKQMCKEQFDKSTKELAKVLGNRVLALMKGEQVEPMESTCPENFKLKFVEMYAKSGIKDCLDAAYGKITNSVSFSNPQDQNKFRNIIQYFLEGFSTQYCNIAYGIYTEEDVDCIISQYDSKAYKHLIKSNIELMNNIDNLGANVKAKISEHLAQK